MIVTAVNVITLISIILTRKQVQDSIKSNDQHILKAIDKEISIIIDNDSFDFMVFGDLDQAAIQALMSLLLIIVKKLTATGEFDKFKAGICVSKTNKKFLILLLKLRNFRLRLLKVLKMSVKFLIILLFYGLCQEFSYARILGRFCFYILNKRGAFLEQNCSPKMKPMAKEKNEI